MIKAGQTFWVVLVLLSIPAMELHELAGFAMVASQRNFTRAAELLRVAQPALSRKIRKLEGELGVELLHRPVAGAWFVSLTPAGKVYLRVVVDILERCGRLARQSSGARLHYGNRLSPGHRGVRTKSARRAPTDGDAGSAWNVQQV